MHYVRYWGAQTAQLVRKAEQSYRKLKKKSVVQFTSYLEQSRASGSSQQAQSWQLPCRTYRPIG